MRILNLHTEISSKTLAEVRQTLASADDSVLVDIDSPGGDLSVGWKVYDLLRESEKKVYTNVSGDCMSAATIIALAAKPENRTASAHAQFLIHKPYIGFYIGPLDGETAKAVSNNIEAEASKICRMYLERTTATESALRLMMNTEQVFGAELAQNLGFVNTINHYNNHKKMNAKEFKDKVSKLVNSFLGNLVALEIETADGKTLAINGEELTVGATTENEDGVYLLPDGRKILVKDGAIAEIQEASAAEEQPTEAESESEPQKEPASSDDEQQKKDEELANLRARVAELENKLTESETALDEAYTTLNKLSALRGKKPCLKSQGVKPQSDKPSYEDLANLMK